MIYIIMCTYNGERYIQEQLQSIEQNLAQDWKIIVSDDQSTDNTVKILKDFEKKKTRKDDNKH